MGSPAGLLRCGDLVEDVFVFAGQKTCSIYNHVDLIGAITHSGANLLQFRFRRHQSRRKTGRNRRDFNGRTREKFLRDSNEVWIDTNRGTIRNFISWMEWLHGFAAEKGGFS